MTNDTRLRPYQTPVTPRLILSTEGFSGSGKTRLGLTMPRPIAYFSLDRGFEDARGELDLSNVDVGDYTLDEIDGRTEAKIMEQADPIWNDLARDWRRALLQGRLLPGGRSELYRSAIMDTGTELYQLIRLTRFGKVAKIPPISYPDLYSEFRAKFIKPAFASDCNVLFTHKLAAERETKMAVNAQGKPVEVSIKTGRYELAGMPDFRGENSYAVPLTIRQSSTLTLPVPERYTLVVQQCKMRPELDGLELVGEAATFATLAQLIYPEMPAEYWE